jgi:hypothetical protein
MSFETGKIYKITCNTTGEVYVGSTILELPLRLGEHFNSYRKWKKGISGYLTSFPLLERGNIKIELIELFPCSSICELLIRETYWFDTIECVNKNRPYRTDEEKKAYKAQWHKDNYIPCPRILLTEDEKKDRKKEYYIDNKDYYQRYRDEHKEKHSEYHKEHYEANKEKYLQQAKARREAVKNDPELLAKEREYKKLKAREYYQKKKLKNKNKV